MMIEENCLGKTAPLETFVTGSESDSGITFTTDETKTDARAEDVFEVKICRKETQFPIEMIPQYELKKQGEVMGKNQKTDYIDQAILDIISYYDEGITSLDLWYEMGEQDSLKQHSISQDEIISRLEYLSKHGFVECNSNSKNIKRWIPKN